MPVFRFLLVVALLCPLVAFGLEDEDEGESPFGRTQWFLQQRLNRSGQVGARERLKALAWRTHLQAVGDAAFPTQNWRLIGPQPESTQTIAISAGRVTALVVDPRSVNTVYAGTAEGGVWKTLDGGANWLPLTDTQQSLAIGSLAIDPSNPDTIYAGTGEGNFNADAYFGSGILKSTDAGLTWTMLAQDLFTGASIGAIAVSPNNSQVLLAGADGGLYRSADGGLTWTNSVFNIFATDVAFDPSDGSQAWAGVCSIFGDDQNGLYHSTDGGLTWVRVSTAPLPPSGIGRIAIAIAPSNPKTIYVGMSGVEPNETKFLGAFVSTDGGVTWTATSGAGYTGDWYRNALAVSPIDPTFAVGGGLEIFATYDGNSTWRMIDSGFLHVDQHAFAFSADGTILYVGNDGGVFSGATSSKSPPWNSLNTTLAITQFYPGFSIHPTDTTLALGGTQDNGALLYSGTPAWTYVSCGDSGGAYIVPQNPQIAYVTCQTGGLFKSMSGGKKGTFAKNMTGVPASEVPFVGVVAGDASDQNVVWWGGATALWFSNNQAASWTKATAALAANSVATVTAIGVVSTDGNTVIFGDLEGSIYCSTNAKSGAATWNACGPSIHGVPISSVVADPAISGAAYLTRAGFGNDHIYHTPDGGQTWTDLQGDLPDIPVSALLADQDAGFLYAATDVGVFLSANNGGHWQPLGNGLPNTAVTGMQLYRSARLLRVSSHGRSMWDLTLPIQPPTLGSNAIVNSASFTGAAPGSIAAAFGTSMADGTEIASAIPLPPSLAGSTLTIAGHNAPVFFASSGQMNVQIPWEAPVGSVSATLAIGTQSSTAPAKVVQYGPAVYTYSGSGQGQGVIVNSFTNVWAAAAGSVPGVKAAAVNVGDTVTIYCTGLGPVTNQPATGAAASGSPLSATTQPVTVSIGGVSVKALFAGLVPGLVGFYQVNVTVPAGVAPSGSVPVVLTVAGVNSNTVTMAVQ